MLLRLSFSVLLFVFSWPLAAQVPNKQPVAVDYLFESDKQSGFTLSSDGKYLAFVEERTRDYLIEVTDIDQNKVIHAFSIGGYYPLNLQWIDDRRLVFNQLGRLVVVNKDGSDYRVLIDHIYNSDDIKGPMSYRRNWRLWEITNRLPNDSEHIQVQAYDLKHHAYLHRINVYTGEKEDLYDGKECDVDFWIANRSGKVLLARKNDDDKYSYYRVDGESGNLKPFDMGFDGHTFNLDYDGRTFLGKRVHLVGFSYDDSHMYVLENITTGRFRLVELDLNNQSHKVILEDDVYDVGTPENLPRIFFDPVKKSLAGVRYEAEKPKTVWFDKDLIHRQAELDKRYPNEINLIMNWSDDKQRLLVYSSSEKTKGKILIYDVAANKAAIQAFFSRDIKPSQVGETKIVHYPARDGYKIEAYLTLPPGREPKNLPTVVLPHGGPFWRENFGFDPYVQYFASRGYAVLSPNYRGSIGYGREHLMAGKSALDNLMIDDIVDGAKWLIEQGTSDREKMHIFGFSYGGYAALMSVIRYPGLFASAASYGAPMDLYQQMKKYKKEKEYFAYEFWAEMVAGSNTKKKHLRSISPIDRVAEITVPVLVAHGKEDPVVSVEQVEDFEKEAKNNKNVSVIFMKDEKHGIATVANNIYLAEKVHALFEKNNASGDSPKLKGD